MKKKTIVLLVVLSIFFIGIGSVSAASIRSSVISLVDKKSGHTSISNKASSGSIPDGYNFGFGKVVNANTTKYNKGSATVVKDGSTIEKAWKSYSSNDITHRNMFKTNSNQIVVRADTATGKNFSVCYPKIGFYGNDYIDVKGTLLETNTSAYSAYYKKKNANYRPIISFASGGNSASSIKGKPGVEVQGVDWARVQWSFTKHNASNPCGGAAVSVKGNTTYWDIDYNQGVAFCGSTKKGLYYSGGTNYVKFGSISSSSGNKYEYIYDTGVHSASASNKAYAVTEVFEGSSITRYYTFVRGKSDSYKARGGIGHSYNAVNTVVTPDPKKETSTTYTNSKVPFEYRVVQTVPLQDSTHYYTQFIIKDTLDSAFDMSYTNGKVKVLNKDGSDVTSRFSIAISGSTVTATANSESLRNESFYGEQYKLVIPVKVKDGVDLSSYPKDGVCGTYGYPRINNTASTTYTNKGESAVTKNANKVDVCVVPDPKKEYAPTSTNGIENAPVKKGDKITYKVTYYNPTSSAQTITIKDNLSKGLEYETASVAPSSKSGSASTGTALTWSIANVPAGSKGEVTYTATVTSDAELIVKNNASVTVGNGPTYQLDELKNPVPVKKYGGTGVSDNDGWDHAQVKKNNVIKYKISLPNVKNKDVNVTLTDVLSKGLKYNEDIKVSSGEVSKVSDLTNGEGATTVVWTVKVPANQTVDVTYSATVTEDAKTLVNNSASAIYEGFPSVKLEELHNPVNVKEYQSDTPSGLNGRIVKSGDTIKYKISYANPYDTDEKIVIRDILSAGLKYNGGAQVCDETTLERKCEKIDSTHEEIKQNEDGSTEIKWTRDSVKSRGIETIEYDIEVTGSTIRVQNDAKIQYGDRPEVDINKVKNPVPKKEYDEKTPAGFDHAAVGKRDRIRYKISYANVYEGDITATIKDSLSKGLTYIKGTSKVNGTAVSDPSINGQNLTWKRNLKQDQEEILTYEALVTGETNLVKNKASMIYSDNPDFEAYLAELKNPVPSKDYASSSSVKKNGAEVEKNQTIAYSIKYSNQKDTPESIVITDVLSRGLDYKKGSAMINGKRKDPDKITTDSAGTMLLWVVSAEAGKSYELTYSAKVTGETKFVENNAQIQYGNDKAISLNNLKNPLKPEEKPPVVIKTPNTASPLVIGVVIAGIALLIGGVYFVLKQYNLIDTKRD